MLGDRRCEAMGQRARERVVAERGWSRHLAAVARLLEPGFAVERGAAHDRRAGGTCTLISTCTGRPPRWG